MGCDIHMWVEKQDDTDAWRPVDYLPPWKCSWCAGVGRYVHSGEACYHCGGKGTVRGVYEGRNYDLFGMLANVRNGRGFAGVRTGGGFEPIHEPRGFPDDMSDELSRWLQADGREADYDTQQAFYKQHAIPPSDHRAYPGDHSASWATLAELDAYFSREGDHLSTHQGWVTPQEFLRWEETGQPDSWCGGVSGGDVKHVSNSEMRDRIARGNAHGCFTVVEWTSTYGKEAGSFYADFLPALRQVGPADRVRIIYNFDS